MPLQAVRVGQWRDEGGDWGQAIPLGSQNKGVRNSDVKNFSIVIPSLELYIQVSIGVCWGVENLVCPWALIMFVMSLESM